jgi:hypothetical protein
VSLPVVHHHHFTPLEDRVPEGLPQIASKRWMHREREHKDGPNIQK